MFTSKILEKGICERKERKEGLKVFQAEKCASALFVQFLHALCTNFYTASKTYQSNQTIFKI